MVRLENIRKSFSGSLVFDIPLLSLDVGFTCLTGASGCGKTTLGRIICGLERADSGEISGVEGQSAVLFQESRLLPALSAIGNATAVCRTDSGRELAYKLLASLSFSDEDIKKRPSELSGGMARRVSIARAIVFAHENSGTFALLDEPFTGLDPDTARIAAEIIREQLGKRCVLVITHDEAECALFGGKTLEFSSLLSSNGKI